MSTKLVERGARIRRTKWVELSCLLCGEAVGTLEGGTVLRPRTDGSVKLIGNTHTEGSIPPPEMLATVEGGGLDE